MRRRIMCEFLDSVLAELAIDVAIEQQRLQIEGELARARPDRQQSPSDKSASNNLLRCGIFNIDAAGGGDLHSGPSPEARQPERRRQKATTESSVTEFIGGPGSNS